MVEIAAMLDAGAAKTMLGRPDARGRGYARAAKVMLGQHSYSLRPNRVLA